MVTPSDFPPRLPQELVDHIIDNLADQWRFAEPDSQSRETLGQCMFVSRSFLTSVRRQLFHRIRLSEKCTAALHLHDELASTERMNGFLQVLKRDPLRATPHPLAAQVRGIKLEMHGVPASRNHSPQSEKSTAKNIQEWNDKRVHLYHIIKATSNLEAFALEFILPMDAHSIHLGIFIAIEKVCHSTNITRLQFTNIYHFPVDLLATCTNLRELRLSAVSLAKPEALGSSTGGDSKPASTILRATWNKDSLRCLETLDTRLSGEVIVAIKEAASGTSSSPPFSQLKTLQLGLHIWSSPKSAEEWEVMNSAARSLECLCIRGIHGDSLAGTVTQQFYGNICLSKLTSLRALKLRTSVPGYSLFQYLSPDLLPLLSTKSRVPTTIETIHLDFYFRNVSNVDDLQHPETIPDRPGIDSVLAGSGLYPRLRTVKVRYLFRSQDYWRWSVTQPPEAMARLHVAVKRAFPQVSASDKIELEISSETFNENDNEYELQW